MAGPGPSTPHELAQVDTLLVPPPLDRESLSTMLAGAISARDGRAPTDAEFRLHEYIDLEALDLLFDHAARREQPEWSLTFTVGDETVTVHSSGLVVFGHREPDSNQG